MQVVNCYRVWCVTDSKFVESCGTTVPTTCPENAGHKIDASHTVIVGQIPGGVTISGGTASLAKAKIEKCRQVDLRTRELIDEGFTYYDIPFSMSQEAQSSWHNLYANRTTWTYPKKISNLNGGETSISSQASVESFYATYTTALWGHLDSGRNIKVKVMAAADQTALDTITDTR